MATKAPNLISGTLMAPRLTRHLLFCSGSCVSSSPESDINARPPALSQPGRFPPQIFLSPWSNPRSRSRSFTHSYGNLTVELFFAAGGVRSVLKVCHRGHCWSLCSYSCTLLVSLSCKETANPRLPQRHKHQQRNLMRPLLCARCHLISYLYVLFF